MRLNAVELAGMNNPVRRALIRWLELPACDRMLARHDAEPHGARILDVGCGEGFTTAWLERRYTPSRLLAFDLMPEQVERARARGLHAEIRVGDVTAIAEPDASFDVAFDIGILHHVEAWRAALVEIGRVLVPGGWFVAEELSGGFIAFADRHLHTAHPAEVRLDWVSFREALGRAGLEVVDEEIVAGLSFIRRFLARKAVAPADR